MYMSAPSMFLSLYSCHRCFHLFIFCPIFDFSLCLLLRLSGFLPLLLSVRFKRLPFTRFLFPIISRPLFVDFLLIYSFQSSVSFLRVSVYFALFSVNSFLLLFYSPLLHDLCIIFISFLLVQWFYIFFVFLSCIPLPSSNLSHFAFLHLFFPSPPSSCRSSWFRPVLFPLRRAFTWNPPAGGCCSPASSH